MNEQGKLSRPDIDGNYSLMYTGLNILKPAIISENPLRIFSLKEYYLNSDKIFGIKSLDNFKQSESYNNLKTESLQQANNLNDKA